MSVQATGGAPAIPLHRPSYTAELRLPEPAKVEITTTRRRPWLQQLAALWARTVRTPR